MRIRWSIARVWLAAWESVAAVALVVAVGRLGPLTAAVADSAAVSQAAGPKLIGFVHVALLFAVAAVVGLVPAAWQAVGPAGSGEHGTQPVTLRQEWRALMCRVGDHRWHHTADPEDGSPVIVCVRCGLTEITPTQVMARIGWPGHQNS